MALRIEILPPERSKVAPVAQPTPSVTIIDAPPTARSDRRDSKGTTTSFRAALDAATFYGVIGGAAAVAPASSSTPPEPRAEKFPAAQAEEITPDESTGLLGVVQATRGTDAPPAPKQEVHRAAAQRYARTFFSDTRTFARPGDSLEISA